MPTLPVLSGRKTVRAFEKLGWQVARQRGSHIILVKEGENVTLSIPDHKEVAKGTLRSLIGQRESQWTNSRARYDGGDMEDRTRLGQRVIILCGRRTGAGSYPLGLGRGGRSKFASWSRCNEMSVTFWRCAA